MKKRCSLFTFLLFLLLNITHIQAQEQFSARYNIMHVTMEQGLLHNFIDDIYKDKLGFLWISTGGGGLSRYDGYEFIHYNTNTSPIKLKSNFIKKVCEDDFNRLWIISEGGTEILDLSKQQLTAPIGKETPFSYLFGLPAIHILKDSKGAIWLYCASSLHKITFDTKGNIAQVFTLPSLPLTIQPIAMQDVDEDGHIWIGAKDAVYKLYPGEGQTLKPVLVSSSLQLEPGTFLSSFCIKENEVWIGTDKGVIRYNRNEEVIKYYQHDRRDHRSLSQNYITDLSVTKDKQLLISTLKGINVYNPISDDFERINIEEPNNVGSRLNSNFINCTLIDGDIIWIGSETGGINKMTPRRLAAKNYTHDKDNPHSISSNPVNAIYQSKKGDLWVGIVEGGLNRKTSGSNQFIHYNVDAPARLSHNSVSAITSDEQERLWVGTWGGGINVLEPKGKEYTTTKYISSITHPGFPIDFIGTLCYDSINNCIWIGANPGIFLYDIEKDKLCTPLDKEIIRNAHGTIGAIIDSEGYLWIGAMEGIYIIDLHSRNQDNLFTYRHLKYKLDDPQSKLIEKASCFCEASDGSIWIGSNGYGIYKYYPQEKNEDIFVSYTTQQGLINNNVRGILEDERGKLWISTNNGLSCFDPLSEHFTNYTKEDGLPSNQFYWNAYFQSEKGKLYFGSLNGLTAIENNQKGPTTIPTQVTLTRLLVANEEIRPGNKYIDKDISIAPTLSIHEKDKSFSLEFSALNYESQSASTYQYRLLGFDKNWIEVPATRRFASYTNIHPGKYTFQVRYNPEGFASESAITSLTIVIKPFFYKTWWFTLLALLLAGCLIFYYYIRRLRMLQKQKETLHQMVEERTRELKEQNEKITRQKQQLIQMSKKVQELTLDKLSFFTNITHEFRTPITLIIGPIERALKLSYNPQVIEQLNFVERNSKYLLSLVNQLMDFRKVESGKLEIVKSKGNFLKFIDSLIIPFEAFAAERNIKIRRLYRMSNPEILFDQDAIQKVVTNLLSNAIKFTPNEGNVSIYVASYINKENGKENLYIAIKDTGTGIAEEELSKIFNRFYQSTNAVKYPVYGQSSTGIGLYLSKRIVKLHSGHIEARNNKKKGSTFFISLPLFREESPRLPIAQTGSLQLSVDNETDTPSFMVGRLTILIVEDNKDMRSYIRSILTEQYNTHEAENGKEALEILNNNHVDFIISDLMMPVMDGIELSRRVKENFTISHIPFLMLTAKTSQDARIESYRMGVDEYLLKPFNEELLLARITNILENRKRYQNRFATNMKVEELHIVEESNDKKFLEKALELIQANYKNSHYESADFIEAMGVSKSLLNRKMQHLVGQSIGQFIRNYRLNIAYELIEKNRISKSMNISEIAYEVGFNDPKYFSRCFTKRYGATPSSLLEGDSCQ